MISDPVITHVFNSNSYPKKNDIGYPIHPEQQKAPALYIRPGLFALFL
jgi:hypothetical protein